MQILDLTVVYTDDHAKNLYKEKPLAYQTPGSSGFDLRACGVFDLSAKKNFYLEYDSHNTALPDINNEDIMREYILLPMQTAMIRTGLKFSIPKGYEAQIRSRSGLSAKNNVFTLNAPGTLDSDYRGEICVILSNFSSESFTIKAGDRIAQAVLCPVIEAKFVIQDSFPKDDESERKEGGFGSTGVN